MQRDKTNLRPMFGKERGEERVILPSCFFFFFFFNKASISLVSKPEKDSTRKENHRPIFL